MGDLKKKFSNYRETLRRFRELFQSNPDILPSIKSPIAKRGMSYRVGRKGEALALSYLYKQGYYVWQQNWSIPAGEIDIIASNGKTLAFIEVKTRLDTTAENFDPFDAVDTRKQQQLQKLADVYIETYLPKIKHSRINNYRFDIIGVILKPHLNKLFFTKSSIIHYQSAFEWN